MKKIIFTDNYEDLSSERGYQFKFYCERCGNGYLSSFKRSAMRTISSMANLLGNIFGGTTEWVASTTEQAQRMAASEAYDKAFEEAIEEIKPLFIQCPKCNDWVCKERCWKRS